MATTSQLLTWIELECHGWQREGPRGSRALLNEAHKILLTNEADQNIVWDQTQGGLPFLATQSRVYMYSCPTSYWRIGAVVINWDSRNFCRDWDLEEIAVAVGGRKYYRVVNIFSRESGQGRVATVQFCGIDPGASTEIYRLYGWRQPQQILSDAIQHEMPGATDVDCLLPATMRLINAINDHQKMEESRQYIIEVLKPRVQRELGKGEVGEPTFCVKRAF